MDPFRRLSEDLWLHYLTLCRFFFFSFFFVLLWVTRPSPATLISFSGTPRVRNYGQHAARSILQFASHQLTRLSTADVG